LKLHRLARRIAAISLPAILVACGGGGSGTPQPAAPAALKVTGTAATGAAMASAAISLKCAIGNATATADANGAYTVSIVGGSLPCVLTATSSDGATKLHSVAAGSGDAATTANITPLSELLVARLAGGDPKAYVASFTAAAVIPVADVAAAQTALLQTLKAAGVDTSNVGDIVSGSLAAGSHSGYDGVLDQLQATIAAAGSTLSEVATAVANTSAAGSNTSASTLSTVLASASTDCLGLKTGPLRVLDFAGGTNSVAQVDAKAMTATRDGTKYTLTRNASCDYTLNDPAATRLLVARSGIAVMLRGSGATQVAAVAIPEQKLDVAAVAGIYDRVQTSPTFDSGAGDFGTTIFAADGKNGLAVNCPLGYGKCVEDTSTDKGSLVANAAGGFDYMEGNPRVSQFRVFAFRNASGRTIMIGQGKAGEFDVLAQQTTLELPAVSSTSSYWQFTVTPTAVSALTTESNTVTAVAAATGTVTRQFAGDSHFDTIAFNAPFAGTRYRAPNGCTSSTGGAFSCAGVVQLPLGGLVLAVSSVPTRRLMSVSIVKP
jgi:hypothetical protein